MGLFKSKATKVLEQKMIVKKTINNMNKQINDLENAKKSYIEKAKIAKKNGLDTQYNLALSGYKLTIAQQKRAQEMLLNFELTSQMKDMSVMTGEFLQGLSILSKEMVKLTKDKEFFKVQQEFEKAMKGVETRTEQMDVFMEMSEDGFRNSTTSEDTISDEEFAKIIEEESVQDELTSDKIDSELQELKKRISSQE